MLFNPAARLSTAVILLRHPRTSADMAVWEFRTLAHLSLMGYPPRSLGNISTRGFVQTGDNVMIGGFIVQGPNQRG